MVVVVGEEGLMRMWRWRSRSAWKRAWGRSWAWCECDGYGGGAAEGRTRGGYYICIYKWVRPPAVDPTRIRAQSDSWFGDVMCVGDSERRWKVGGELGGPEGR